MSHHTTGHTPLASTSLGRVMFDLIKSFSDALRVGLHLKGRNRGMCSLGLLQGLGDILPGLLKRADVAVWTLPLCIPGGRKSFPCEHQHGCLEECT